ncbi:hypothetical protein EVAR_20207_1 [Eumeta japonica]|uniref:Uncharacterized protein n=1 Tax=Eumeta variegata TaxID=151549 RepID=A0A4C1UV34_EUMVA|nr:hypothetical protein EVAR_20207_1 [Eumeta japonica]
MHNWLSRGYIDAVECSLGISYPVEYPFEKYTLREYHDGKVPLDRKLLVFSEERENGGSMGGSDGRQAGSRSTGYDPPPG